MPEDSIPNEHVPLNYSISEEVRTLKEQGYDTSSLAKYNKKALAGPVDLAYHDKFYAEVEKLKAPRSLAKEPSELAAIKKLRPRGPRRISKSIGAKAQDRILGAWLGRCVGCQIGKPVEGMPRDKIVKLLKKTKAWPLDDYVPFDAASFKHSWYRHDRSHFRGNIQRMKRDDDIDYTILGLAILEQYGPKFTTTNVAVKWLESLQYHQVYTAERIAYRNLVGRVPISQVGGYRNPYREWIGAYIRADGFGYMTPGWPEKGAEFAHRDSFLSHRGNGIYGEMFFAAALSAALVEEDIERVLEIGLSEIPAECRLAEAVKQTMEWCKADTDWEKTFAKIEKEYGHYNWVHTINNAAIVIMGLMHGKGNLGVTAGIAVMGGWDTDCNGATAGSVLGAMLGAKRLPKKLVDPLNDTIDSIVLGFTESKISDLAQRTVVQARKIAHSS